MSHFAMSLKGNSKTNCPTTTTEKSSCPDTCALKLKGCYAKYSFLGGYWTKLSNGEVKNSLDFKGLLKAVRGLNDGALWRHNQAGDLSHEGGKIDRSQLSKLVKASKGKKGFTYTHHVMTPENALTVDYANENGFTINLSTENLKDADKAFNLECAPVVTLLPIGSEKVTYTPENNKVIKCPASVKKGITCATCKMCAVSDRDYIIGFEVHGSAKKTLDLIAKG